MSRILLTGMSGTGKSTLLRALQTDDNITVDLDDGWIAYDPVLGEAGIDIQRVLRLFGQHPDREIILAGCAVNQTCLYPYLTAIITLTAPLGMMRRRILSRTDNPFGKTEEEWARIVQDKEEIEPLLIRGSSLVVDTDRPLAELIREIGMIMRGTD